MNRHGRLVYSTGPDGRREGGDERCATCAAAPCECEPRESLAPGGQRVRVRRERSGRRGKTVTVCAPLILVRADAKELLRELKRLCGGGGTLKPGRDRAGQACFELEIQGDHVDSIVDRLRGFGYPARPSV